MMIKNRKMATIFALGGIMLLSACSSTKGLVETDLSGEWTVVSIAGQSVEQNDKTPFVGFKKDGFYGFTGCNRISGGFDWDKAKKGEIDLSKVASTMRLCPDDKFERPFMTEIAKVKGISLKSGKLNFLDDKGNAVLVFERSK